jgi:hypothetical protein
LRRILWQLQRKICIEVEHLGYYTTIAEWEFIRSSITNDDVMSVPHKSRATLHGGFWEERRLLGRDTQTLQIVEQRISPFFSEPSFWVNLRSPTCSALLVSSYGYLRRKLWLCFQRCTAEL